MRKKGFSMINHDDTFEHNNDTQDNDIQHNDTQNYGLNCDTNPYSITTLNIIAGYIMCLNSEFHYAM